MREYGTIRAADYAGRGDLAPDHAKFVIECLLPYLEKHYPISEKPIHRAMAGFSLGGLSAFDLAWHHSDSFGLTGVFSGALWWRSIDFDPEYPDANRILHTQVAQDQRLPKLKFWFQTGTLDEKEDRNNNGIIDSIDDTLDLIKVLESRAYHPQEDLHYHEVEGGKHHPKTWAKVLPDFIRWALN
jgi:enterochelin esterase-like enzyme